MRTALLSLLVALASVPVVSPAMAAGPLPELPPFEPDAAGERSAIPEVYKWDLGALYPSEQALTDAMAALGEKIPSLETCRGQLGDPTTLERCLTLYFELHDGINHATLYANLALATAQSDDHLRGLQQQTLALLDRLTSKAGFLRAELLELDETSLERAYASRPGLATFRPYLDNLRRRRSRLLSEEGERLLALAGDNLWAEIDLNEIPSAHEKTFGALLADIPWPEIHDEQGQPVQLTLANYSRYRASASRQVRREAVTAFLGTLRQYQHALAGTLAGQYAFSKQPYPYPDLADWHRRLLQTFGADRLMWASDFPWILSDPGYGPLTRVVDALLPDLTARERADIMGGTAKRFLRFPDPPGSL